MTTSIRRQLVAWLLVAVGGVLAATGVALHATAARALTQQFDAGLEARARALAALVEREGIYVEFAFVPEAMPEYVGGDEPAYFTLWLEDLPDAMASPTLDGAPLERRSGGLGAPVAYDLALPDGRAGRALGIDLPVVTEDEDEDDDDADDADAVVETRGDLAVTIVVATSRAELDARVRDVAVGLALAGLAALTAAVVAITLAVRRGLRPVERLASRVAAIDASDLSPRVGADELPRELAPIGRALDELLERLERSFAKERRMTGAIAHELRTPIAELRAAADVARAWPDDAELRDDLASTAAETAERMGATIDALMRYCRLETGDAAPLAEDVPLAAFVDEVVRPHRALAEERGVAFVVDVPDGLVVRSDRGLLALALGNLVQNAASFGDAGDARVTASTDAGGVTLTVVNGARALTPADVEHLDEPFWRKDAARSGGTHSGLGLALARAVVAALGGRLSLTLEGGRLRATMHGLDASSSRHLGAGGVA